MRCLDQMIPGALLFAPPQTFSRIHRVPHSHTHPAVTRPGAPCSLLVQAIRTQ